MNMRNIWFLLLLVLGTLVYAQEPQAVLRLVYADSVTKVTLTNPDGKVMAAKIGLEIVKGWRIKTAATVAEFQLIPNGSKIRVAAETSFTVDSLQLTMAAKDGK